MAISIYDISVPLLLKGLKVTTDYIDKADAFCAERKIEPAVLINARLAPDMLPFSGQVQRVSDGAKAGMGRLTGIEVPSFPDTETTFAQLKERVQKTEAFIKSVPQSKLDGTETRKVELKMRDRTVEFTGLSFVTTFLLPNLYFHVTTAHDILRHNGVNIGKRDYLGAN